MQRHNWQGKVWILLVCSATIAAFCVGCTDRRSEGKKPVVVDEENKTGFQASNQAGGQNLGEYQHVGLKQQFPGGVEPNDFKAQKLVNQLFNYSIGFCATQQECPADLAGIKKGIQEQYKIIWPKDPWGNPYQYKKTGDVTCDVWSMGPDGKDGTDDDIHVSKKNLEDVPN